MSDIARSLTLFTVPGIEEVEPGQDLARVLGDAFERASIVPRSNDILVVAQKIVSKAENRYVRLDSVEPSPHAMLLAEQTEKDPRIVEIILRQSREVVKCRPGLIVVEHKLGFVMANAGIDRSNVPGSEERVLLLPENPDASARTLGLALGKRFGVELGVVISDSVGRAWRLGTIGTAIGLHRVPGLVDLRGLPDRDGRLLEVSQVGLADQIASAAALLIGEANEGTPVVVVRGMELAKYDSSIRELVREKDADMFR